MKKYLLLLIFVLAFILRFYKLGEIPYGLYQDETAIGFNAYSLLQTGRDEYGQKLPLYFKSFGDWKLPVYIYSTAASIKLFGLNEFSVRFPSALFGFLTVIAFYFLIKKLTENQSLSLTATALLAINPWHLHYSRAVFEVSLCLFFYVFGGWLILKSLKDKFTAGFLVGTLCFILSVYSYNLTRFLSFPLYFLILFFYRSNFRTISLKEKITTIVLSLILLFPLVKTFLADGGFSSAGGTLIFTSQAVLAPLLEMRSYLVNLPDLFVKIFYNKIVLIAWQYLNNLAGYLSISFFFISGSSHGNHGIGNFGQFYLFELPLILLGIGKIIKEKIRWGYMLFGWGLITIMVASLTREVPHATRSFFLLVPLEIFSAMGLIEVWRYVMIKIQPCRIGSNLLKRGIILIAGFLFFYNLVFYFVSYYVRFPVLYAKAWRLADKNLSLYLKENEGKYQKIIIDDKAGFIYTSFLFYSAFNPGEFQQTVKRNPDDNEGFSTVASFGKYEFREIDRDQDYRPGSKTLIITTFNHKPQEAGILRTFSYPRKPVVFSVKEKLVNYSEEEIAYVLVETL